MIRQCTYCPHTFPTRRAYWEHWRRHHRHPKPPAPLNAVYEHPVLSGQPCDQNGVPLEGNAPPPPPPMYPDTAPFSDRPAFDFAYNTYAKMQGSEADINDILRDIRARNILQGHDVDPLFKSYEDLVTTIDQITIGDVPFITVSVRWAGPVDENSPQWKREAHVGHHRDIIETVRGMAANPELNGHWDNTPTAVFNADGLREYSNLMTGQWAWDQAVLVDPETLEPQGAMLTPVLLGADKTTVSVGTGNRAYYPLYTSLGNIHNDVRCSHSDAVTVLAFLPIIKGSREDMNDKEFRLFRKQVYHTIITHILSPLRPHMHEPMLLQCPDQHWRQAIFELGPFLADYPEQVDVCGIVQGWCPKCLAFPDELDNKGLPRFRDLTEHLQDVFDPGTLWDVFGLLQDISPFTYSFPRADIHELLTPDLLHQLVKGTSKDHLVAWIEDYIVLTSDSETEAKRKLDGLDRRLAAVPSFSGLRRLPQGRNFTQWTGDDSKALMKVLLPALVGVVPDDVIECVRVFLDFAYLARLSVHTSVTIDRMEALLEEFCIRRTVFIDAGVRMHIFLPRQHALEHYCEAIERFGSLNGLSTSITESKHIEAVKRPWRASNRNDALPQMLQRNVRLSKLNALRAALGSSGLLEGEITDWAMREYVPFGFNLIPNSMDYSVSRARLTKLGERLGVPDFYARVRRFVRAQTFEGIDDLDEVVPLEDCPWIDVDTRMSLYSCAHATYFAPSELSLPGGMYSEMIRCSADWQNKGPRYDTVLVQVRDADDVMGGMVVARLCELFSFTVGHELFECALVEWFNLALDTIDALTGMWVVKPEKVNNQQAIDIIPLDSIVRSCHLIPYFGTRTLKKGWDYRQMLRSFKSFYVNCYIDYHSFELLK
ncbi:uncharacterized protein BXZ73DRAFT_54076 [Epithele typhae]|uniref:uncharacterized protein n=1 Tax=Epithele typhae TaxID=378194 RepID=UPI002007E5E9|nr:uncharacterized protein BXZ73DRAFT_54076 [Epithele typhae]KAH9915965.1 hypothetical protein BXZ73DRAFT_54076 [Epithele typhae]